MSGMQLPYNEVFKKQNDKTSPAFFKKGIINKTYRANYTADVRLVGNEQTIIKNVHLSSSVFALLAAGADLTGFKCRIDIFDETNPNDMIVAYVYY